LLLPYGLNAREEFLTLIGQERRGAEPVQESTTFLRQRGIFRSSANRGTGLLETSGKRCSYGSVSALFERRKQRSAAAQHRGAPEVLTK
jgi:hypothetical protein